MRDTTEAVYRRMRDLLMNKTGEERLMMGASMFDMAKQLARASLKGMQDEGEERAALFMRFYGSDFSEEQRERIISHLSAHKGARNEKL